MSVNSDGLLNKAQGKSNRSLKWVVAGGSVLVIALLVVITVLLLRPAKVVSSFEQCKAAGGVLLESYPERCMINGNSFTNLSQSISNK